MKILAMGLAIWMGCALSVAAQVAEQGVVVTGQGRVSAPPDMATISLGVSKNAETAKQVVAQVNDAVAQIVGALQEMGVEGKDLQTTGFYLQPLRNQQMKGDEIAPKITGYQAGNMVTVRVRDLDRLGDMMDAVIDLGGNQFNGLQFGLQDDADAMAQARAGAVADAKLRAEQLAQAADIDLGALLRMSEQGHHAAPRMAGFAAQRSAMSEAAVGGEVDVTVQVTMVYAIAPKGG